MKYERVMWALARELHSMQRDDPATHWSILSPAKKANLHVKADHALNGWGFENKNGELVRRAAPTSETQQASFAAVNEYLDRLVEKHPEEPATTQRAARRKTGYEIAATALAVHAYRETTPADAAPWTALPNHDRAAFQTLARALLAARGFVNVEGTLQFSEGNGPIFAAMSHVLRDGFALNRVEALAHEEPIDLYERKQSTDAVHEVMLRASKKYGGTDGAFNSACFSEALLELAGVKQPIDGKVVAAILLGRSDVEVLSGRAHYRVLPIEASNAMEVRIGNEVKQASPERTVREVFRDVFGKLRESDPSVKVRDYAAENDELLKRVDDATCGVVLPLRAARSAPEAVSKIDANEPPSTLPHTERAPHSTNPFVAPSESLRARLAAASPFPVNEDGAERYDAVTAPATAVYGAEDVLARDLYEKQTPADRKHWEDLRGDHQKSYRMQAGMIPLNLPELSRTFEKQWADDVRAGRKQGVAPTLKEVERIVRASDLVGGKIDQSDAVEAGVTLTDIEQALPRKEAVKRQGVVQNVGGSKRVERDTKTAERYLKLAALAYKAIRVMHPDMPAWCSVNNDDQSRAARAAEHGWLGHAIGYINPLLAAIAGAASTFHEIADQECLDLAAFVNTARMRVIMTDITKDEAELLAWYAHESSRAEVPGIISWGWLSTGIRERKVLDAYNYVTEQAVNPHLTPEFYSALDAFLADVGQFASKMERLRKARAELGSLPADWTSTFRQ